MKKEIEKLIYLANILDIKGFVKEAVELDTVISKLASSKLIRTLTLKTMDLSNDTNVRIALNDFLHKVGVKPGGLDRHDAIDALNELFEFHEVQVGLGQYYLTGLLKDNDTAFIFDPISNEWKIGSNLHSVNMRKLLHKIYSDHFNKRISTGNIQLGFKQVNSKTFYDFGKGLVPAHKHSNGGGWVADTAKVAPSAIIGSDAFVYDFATVADNAVIFDSTIKDYAFVAGSALINGDSSVSDYGSVVGDSHIWGSIIQGNASIKGDAIIRNSIVEGNTEIDSGKHSNKHYK